MRIPGKEFSHLLCSPYNLQCTLLHSIHHPNWYLVEINIIQEVNWQFMNQCKQVLINKSNQRGNLQTQSYVYCTGDNILLKNAWKTKFNKDTYIGPYILTAVRNNGTVGSYKGNVTDTDNLCNITPFKE